ncbi:MAG: DUF4168 domain-containing protein, partial [Spirochaetia bacterium]
PASIPESIEDEEIDTFIDALTRIQSRQKDYQTEAQELVGESPLSEQRLNEINQIKNNFPEEEETITPDESRQYDRVMSSLEELNRDFQEETITIIQDEGMTPERFQVVANYINANPEVLEERMN